MLFTHFGVTSGIRHALKSEHIHSFLFREYHLCLTLIFLSLNKFKLLLLGQVKKKKYRPMFSVRILKKKKKEDEGHFIFYLLFFQDGRHFLIIFQDGRHLNK